MQTLHLEGVKTISALDVGREIVAHAEVTLKPECCPECKHKELYAFGTRATRYQDLPMHGEQVLINLRRQRYRCRNPKCKHTFMPAHPEFDTEFRLTNRAVRYIEQQSPVQTFDFIAQHIGVDERTVRRVFWRYAQNREKTLKPSYQTSDGKCYASYEEAQKAELAAFFAGPEPNACGYSTNGIVETLLEHAAEIREILAPQIGRPLGSKNGVTRSRKKAAPQLPLDDVAPEITGKE